MEQKGKSPLDLIFSVNTNHESVAYRSFSPSEFEARGARKVTTGMTKSIASYGNRSIVSPRPCLLQGLVRLDLNSAGSG